jgi:hypothetical protein
MPDSYSRQATSSGNLGDCQMLVNSGHSNSTDWTGQRNQSSCNVITQSAVFNLNYTGAAKSSSQPFCYRTTNSFNFYSSNTGIPTNATITSLTYKFTTGADTTGFGVRTNTGSVYIAKGIFTDATATTAWNDMHNWASSGSYEGQITKYADSATSVAASTTYEVNLNSTAIADAQACVADGGSDQSFELMVIWDKDWTDNYSVSGSGFFVFNGAAIQAAETSDSSKRPYLTTTYTVGGDDAIFFGTIF